jgi:hypothetical protein
MGDRSLHHHLEKCSLSALTMTKKIRLDLLGSCRSAGDPARLLPGAKPC